MRRCLISGLAFQFLLLHANASAAQEGEWSLKAGLSLWSNTWQANLNDINPEGTDNNIVSVVSGRKLVPVGLAELRYRQYTLFGSYFKRTTYTFPEGADGGPFSTQIERSQYDLNVGWYFTPELALTAGYKNVQFRFTTATLGAFAGSTSFYDIFPVGFVGRAPMSRGLSLYGSLTAGPAKAKYSDGGSAEGSYWASEFGLGYALRNNLSANIGYRSETISVRVGSQTNRDVLSGFLAGLTYTFF